MSRSAKVANIETQLPSINVRIVTFGAEWPQRRRPGTQRLLRAPVFAREIAPSKWVESGWRRNHHAAAIIEARIVVVPIVVTLIRVVPSIVPVRNLILSFSWR
jgi:hypothetical protein